MSGREKDSEKPKRNIVSIALTDRANAAIDKWLLRSGGWGKGKLVETLFERFAEMPESVQQIVIGSVPDDLRDAYAQKASDYFTNLAKSPSLKLVDDEPIEIPAGKGRPLKSLAAKNVKP